METELVIKNEGTAMAYKFYLMKQLLKLMTLNWDKLIKENNNSENDVD